MLVQTELQGLVNALAPAREEEVCLGRVHIIPYNYIRDIH
jgi:hypothetical protein